MSLPAAKIIEGAEAAAELVGAQAPVAVEPADELDGRVPRTPPLRVGILNRPQGVGFAK